MTTTPSAARSCRFCGQALSTTFADLGMSPLSNSYLDEAAMGQGEEFYPLHAYVCDRCFLVQLETFSRPEDIFSDYAYFSSYSDSWLEHARTYARKMAATLELGPDHRVIEIASNDGYLLQYFKAQGIGVLGIEPAANVAEHAHKAGIPTRVRFFGSTLARELVSEGLSADLLIGNNVLAHVPDLNDFVSGLAILLGPRGTLTMEFPHLLRLIEGNQFDTIYHEHFSYLSLSTVEQVFAHHGLSVFDVEELSTHGGSLRIHARRIEDDSRPIRSSVAELVAREQAFGLGSLERYRAFDRQVQETKRRLLAFLIEAKRQGKTLVGYGAPAKGNTLLNYCGIRTDFLDYTVDRSPHKQGRYLPGSRIPIFGPEEIARTRPDYVLILPWNLKDEIVEQMAEIRSWGGKFVVPIPEVAILD